MERVGKKTVLWMARRGAACVAAVFLVLFFGAGFGFGGGTAAHASGSATQDVQKDTDTARVNAPAPAFYEREAVQDAGAKVALGEVVAVAIEEAREGEQFVVLLQGNRVFARAPVVRSARAKAFAFVAIPADIKPGAYQLALESAPQDKASASSPKDSPKVYRNARAIVVSPTAFPSTSITVSTDLARVREPNPETVKQARELWAVTGTLFAKNLFQYERFSVPLKRYKYISGEFSERRVYKNRRGKEVGSVVHGGIDFAAPTGTVVYSAAAGKVVFAGKRIVTGNTVTISHYPGIVSLYEHLDSIAVKEGDVVTNDMPIGTVGSTGFSTGPHLHWEMRVNNVRVNPMHFVKKTAVIRIL